MGKKSNYSEIHTLQFSETTWIGIKYTIYGSGQIVWVDNSLWNSFASFVALCSEIAEQFVHYLSSEAACFFLFILFPCVLQSHWLIMNRHKTLSSGAQASSVVHSNLVSTASFEFRSDWYFICVHGDTKATSI